MRNHLKSIYRSQEGTTAVEFAIIAPVFLLLILGTIGLCFALFGECWRHFGWCSERINVRSVH